MSAADPTGAAPSGGSPDVGAAAAPPAAGPPSGPPPGGVQAQGNPAQMMIAQMYQICRRLEMESPQMAPGLRKACEGLQEAQTSMLMNRPQVTPPEQNPPV